MKKTRHDEEIDPFQEFVNADAEPGIPLRSHAIDPDGFLDRSRNEYSDLYDFAPIGYVTLSETGIVEDINVAGATLIGLERGRLLKKPFTICMSAFHHERFREHLQACLDTGQAATELQLRLQGGTYLDAQLLSVAVLQEETGGHFFRTAIIDISQRRIAEDALRKSEIKYRSLYTFMREGLAFYGLLHDGNGVPVDYRILDVNPAFEKIMDTCRDKAIGSRGTEFFGEEIPPHLDIFSEVALTGKSTVFETTSFKSKRTLRVSVFSPAKGSFATVFEDITKKKRTEEALKESEQRYRRLVEYSPDATVVITKGKYVYANNAAFKLFGAAAHEQLIGRPVIDTVEPEFGDFFWELLRTVDEGMPAPLQEMQMVRLDGTTVDVEVVGTPITYRGKPSIQALIRDISDRKQAKEELQRAYQELEKRVMERTEQLARTIDALQKEIHTRQDTEKALRNSEERYALAVQGANDGIWDADLLTGELYLSPRWKGILGYEDDELANEPGSWTSRIHPDDLPRVLEHRRAYLAGEIPAYQIEHRLLHRDGSYRWILTRGSCLRDVKGKAYRMAGSHTDVTERKQAEDKILRLNHLYAVLSETNKAIVRSSNQETVFAEVCNVAVECGGFSMAWVGLVDPPSGRVLPVAAAGVSKEELLKQRVSVLDEPAGNGLIGKALRDGTYKFTNNFLSDQCTAPWHEEAARRNYRAAAAIALKLNGEVVGALNLYAGEVNFFDQQLIELLQEMAADISFALDRFDQEHRHRQAEKALQAETARRLQAVEALRAREQMLMQQSRLAAIGEMIGNIAHQWRQPLNTLGLYLQGLTVAWEMGDFQREEADQTISKAMDVIFHMSQTIDDFRYFFKPDKEKISFNIHEVVTKTVSLIDGSYKDRHIALEVIAEAEPSLVGYPNEYSQVLLNILSNARDALIERKVAEPQVAVRLFVEGDRTVVTIADNAGGIPENIMHRIFDPYFTTKDPDRGTGVGLFISKTIIEKNMGGRLTACNCGDGAKFRIEV